MNLVTHKDVLEIVLVHGVLGVIVVRNMVMGINLENIL